MMPSWQDILVVEGEQSETPCDCCQTVTRTIHGDLEHKEDWLGFYTTRWSEGHPENGTDFFLSVGDWSEHAQTSDRWVAAARYSPELNSFMLLDIRDEFPDMRATKFNRDDIIGTEFATDLFAMLDAIFMKESRLEGLRP